MIDWEEGTNYLERFWRRMNLVRQRNQRGFFDQLRVISFKLFGLLLNEAGPHRDVEEDIDTGKDVVAW